MVVVAIFLKVEGGSSELVTGTRMVVCLLACPQVEWVRSAGVETCVVLLNSSVQLTYKAGHRIM